MRKLKGEELKSALRYVFSFEENIDVFSKFFFPEAILGEVPDFHKEFYSILMRPGNDAIAAPRGHAKSTTAGLVFIAFQIVNKREKYIVYISQNHAKTVQFLTPLRYEFKNNELLRLVYGNLEPMVGKDDDGKDREDCIDVQGARIEAVSFEKNLRGFKYRNTRPTLIIGDDIEEDTRVVNPELRKKDEDKLNKVIIPALDIDGRFKMIGTILHLDSLLKKKLTQYEGKIYTAETEDGKLLWPERFTREKLDEIKREIGTVAYQQEFLNNPVDNTTSIIKREWVEQCFDENFNYTNQDMNKMYLGGDFAFSDRVTADSTSFVDVGTKDDRRFIMDIDRYKGLSITEQMDIVKSKHTKNKYALIGFEENSILSYSKDIKNMRLPIKMFWMGSRDEKDPKLKNESSATKSKTIGKVNAVIRLAASFENKQWVIPYKTESQKKKADLLLAQLTSWALEDGKLVELGVHPDDPIALIMVQELLDMPKAKVLWV